MNEANITPGYLKRKFPGDSRMHAVIDYIKRDTGLTTYIYIAFASDAAGADFTLTPSSTLEYIAILSTTIKKTTPVVADFDGLWFKRIGDDGREIELNVSAGYLVWRYVGDTEWTQIYQIPTYVLPLQITGITLLAASWSLVSGLYEYDLANANITANHVVDVIPENADIAIVKSAEILPKTVSSAGSVKLYATNAPTGNVRVTIILTTATT